MTVEELKAVQELERKAGLAMVFLFSDEVTEMKCGEARDEVRKRFGEDVEAFLQKRFSGQL